MRRLVLAVSSAALLVVPGVPAAVAATYPPGYGSLHGVSCVSSTFCVAVGFDAGRPTSLVWHGSSWSRVATVVPAGDYATLDAVSCTSTTRCTAVGYSQTYTPSYLLRPMVQVFDGTHWTMVSSVPKVGVDSRLSGVSCPLTTFCAATGTSVGSDQLHHSFIEQWNGTAWRSVPSSPRGWASYLQGVSCSASRTCTAVGSGTGHDGSYRTTVEERDAATPWTLVSSPNRSFGDQLNSVDCYAAHGCTSAGSIVIVRSADGWSRQHSPFDSDDYAEYGVSCVDAAACEAVGGAGPGAMGWDGSHWRKQATPELTGGGTLLAVDCVAADDCLAVGETIALDQGRFPYPTPLAERWDGTSWTRVSTP